MSASNMNFYEGDLVIKNSPNIEVGEVIETDEFLNGGGEDEIEIEGQQSMEKDHIRVNWLDETVSVEKTVLDMIDFKPNQEVLPERKVKLYDRRLYEGLEVKRVGSEEGQLGYILSRSITADVQVVGTQHILTNIKSTDLERQKDGFWILCYRLSFYMYCNGWRHPFFFFMVRIMLRLLPTQPPHVGARGFLTMKDSYNVVSLREWKTLMAAKLNISPRRVKAPWQTSWTLKNVYTYCFGYLWIIFGFYVISRHFLLWCYNSNVWSKGLNGIDFEFLGRYFQFYCCLQFSTTIVRSKILKKWYFETVLCYFSFCCLVGLLLPNFHNELNEYFKENVKYIAVNVGEKYFNFLGYLFLCYCSFKAFTVLRCIVRRGLRRSLKHFAVFFWREKVLVPEERLTVDVLVTQTKADVVWQDGTVELNILSTKLSPDWDMPHEHDFFPGDHVLGREGSFADFPSYDYGVVKKVDHPGRTAIIKWMKINDADENPHPEVITEQYVSVYDITRHPELRRDVISVNNLDPSAEDDHNEDNPIASDDPSSLEHPLLVLQEDAIQEEEEGESYLCPTIIDSEPKNKCQLPCAVLKSTIPRLETSCNELGLDANEKKPIDVEEQSKDFTERKATANENLLEGISEQDSMLKMDLPGQGVLSMAKLVPESHKYKLSIFQHKKLGAFKNTVRKEMDILKSSLPNGIVVKCFEDRIDLFSVLIKGPKMTPYEDGLFFFDLQLPADYPNSPPLCHYVSYSKGRLIPNLHEGGKVSVSILDTFSGKGTQMWNKETSSLLQVVASIQGLILVSEPCYNEPGYQREKGTPLGNTKSRLYNEKVLLMLVEAMIKLKMNPPELFQKEISDHFQTSKMVERLERWVEISETWNTTCPTSPASPSTSGKLHEDVIGSQDEVSLPEFPLIPASKGFCLTLKKSLEKFKNIVANQES